MAVTIVGSSVTALSPLLTNAQTGTTYTLVLSDAGKHIYMNHSNNYVWLSIPTNANVAFDIGTAITVVTNQNEIGRAHV